MCAAVLARGQTVITSAAVEPEIVDLGRFLVATGAKIIGLGTRVIEIDGVEGLDGATHRVIPDRIEAGTLLIATAATGGQVSIQNVNPTHLSAVLEVLTASGAEIKTTPNVVSLRMADRARPISIDARPYPGVPTDLQAQLMALAATARGTSRVTDAVFPDRFRHVDELVRLGACVVRRGASVTVDGVERLSGAIVTASDLRASAALVLAGLAAEGETIVRRANHLDRGYKGLDQKLRQLGANLSRTAYRDHTLSHGVRTYSQSPPRRQITN
jgi:UDP-N-acetylglucosamine 1-carboxyvinyltransferase